MLAANGERCGARLAKVPAMQDRATPLVSTNPETCVPSQRRTTTPLAPLEKFVLSRIDGHRSIADVAGLVMLSSQEALHVVLRLHSLGAVAFDEEDDWSRDSVKPTLPGLPIV
jgi:hypothetical protein